MSRSSVFLLLDRAWSLITHRIVPSLLLALVAVMMLTTVFVDQPARSSWSWWRLPYRHSEMLGLLVLFASLALLFLVVRQVVPLSQPLPRGVDAGESGESGETKGGPLRWLPRLGWVLLFVGGGLVAADWALSQRVIPPSDVTMQTNHWIQRYRAETTDRSMQVMLPSEVALHSVEGPPGMPKAKLQFRKVGAEAGVLQTLVPNQPLLVEGNAWALTGIEYSRAALRATFVPESKDAIANSGGVGDTIRFQLDGETYTIEEIGFKDYPELGPYAILSDSEGRYTTVFEKPTQVEPHLLPSLPPHLWLGEIEAAPLATLTVSRLPDMEWLVAGILTALVGLVLVLMTQEHVLLLGVRLVVGASPDEKRPQEDS